VRLALLWVPLNNLRYNLLEFNKIHFLCNIYMYIYIYIYIYITFILH
jgi:hypothetical protein